MFTCSICQKFFLNSLNPICPCCQASLVSKLQFHSNYLFNYQGGAKNALRLWKQSDRIVWESWWKKRLLNNPTYQNQLQECDFVLVAPGSHHRLPSLISRTSSKLLWPVWQKNTKGKQQERKRRDRIDRDNFIQFKNKEYLASKVQNKRILLIDDVWSTGTTLEQCRILLSELRPKQINYFVLCKNSKATESVDND